MDTLEARRRKLCIKFAKQCLKHNKFRSMFPVNKSSHKMDKKMGKNAQISARSQVDLRMCIGRWIVKSAVCGKTLGNGNIGSFTTYIEIIEIIFY